MAFIDEVVEAIKLEPSVVKLEPEPLVEIYPADVYRLSDEEENDEDMKVDISEIKIEEDESEDQDEHRDNESRATDNVREDEQLVLNFNKQAIPVTTDKLEETIKMNLIEINRTRQSTNLLEDIKKVKKVYGSSWSIPIQRDEYTYKSQTSMTCNYCHREFYSRKNLATHIRVIHRESGITYHCPYCPKQARWNLRDHILLKHKDESEVVWFQCFQCDKKFRLKSELKKHFGRHLREINGNAAMCLTCGQIFPSQQSMKVHIDKDHQKRHHCEICDYTGENCNCSDIGKFHKMQRTCSGNQKPYTHYAMTPYIK